MTVDKYKAIVIGVSAGGMAALTKMLSPLPGNFPLPVIIVQHLHSTQEGFLVDYCNNRCALTVKEADEKDTIKSGYVYFAPPDYHLLIERDKTFSLSTDEKVNYSRPSIDVLFESAVDAYSSALIGIILTGANNDGAAGLKLIKKKGGLTIVQDPLTAEYPPMPRAAIETEKPDYILPLEKIAESLIKICENMSTVSSQL